jgi:hypothetical protein
MYQLTPNRPNVIDAATGSAMPEEGVQREVLLPPDHYALRGGDITITEIKPEEATPAAAHAAEKRESAKTAKS